MTIVLADCNACADVTMTATMRDCCFSTVAGTILCRPVNVNLSCHEC